MRELKKTAAAVAKVAACDVVYISGMTGDEYITLSANGDGGEISRRVALSSGLTFNFATALKVANIKSINNAADTLYISYFNTIVFAGAKVVGLVNPSYDSDNATPTAAGAKKIATKLKDFCNVYKEFTAPVAPADSIQTEDTAAPQIITAAAVVRALAQSLTLAAVYGAQRTAAALKAARRATIAARAWLRASHDFYAQDGDPIRCTGWQFVGYNIAAAVVAVLLSIKY